MFSKMISIHKVDLPEPGGPIRAVAVLGAKVGTTLDSALKVKPLNNKLVRKKSNMNFMKHKTMSEIY